MSAAKDGAEPDLTPILDMVFQLITFFMLVINFKSASLDMSLKLPVVGSARPVDNHAQEDLLVLNINSSGKLNVYGETKDVDSYISSEARAAAFAAKRENRDFKSGDELPTIVIIRADKTTPFHLLNHVIKTCQDKGFRRFALKAMNRHEDNAGGKS
ncbi:MAG: biopolymer transporter ExbD [Pirellulales bacterium]